MDRIYAAQPVCHGRFIKRRIRNDFSLYNDRERNISPGRIHGLAVYALKNAKDISALKAVSQNLMHANLSITDGVYGVLSGMDVKGEITELAVCRMNKHFAKKSGDVKQYWPVILAK